MMAVIAMSPIDLTKRRAPLSQSAAKRNRRQQILVTPARRFTKREALSSYVMRGSPVSGLWL
jgi:hypothetical protein